MTRVLTLNLQHGVLGATGAVATAEELADVLAPLRAEPPDVLALQEADRGQARSRGMDQVQLVADAIGLPHVRFAAAVGDLTAGRSRPERAGEHPGPAYGVSIATRYPVLASFVRPLPGLSHLLGRRLTGRLAPVATDEPRVLLGAVLQAPTGPLAVASTHLSTLAPVALVQLRQVLASMSTLGSPAIICGDLNLGPLPVRALTRGWHRAAALTYPVGRPDRQIDHVLARARGRRASLAGVRSLPLGISDHRGLCAELRL